MKQTTFQHPELRDANDNIIQQGAFGKNTALANSTNDGWIDYVANDLMYLYNNTMGGTGGEINTETITGKTGTITNLTATTVKAGTVTADALNGPLTGNVTGTADKAVADGNGNNIAKTYVTKSGLASSVTTGTGKVTTLTATDSTLTNLTVTGETTVPTANAGNSSKAIANTEFVAKSIASLVNGAPDQLNTLNELAKALGNDSNFAATMTAELAKKLNSTEAESTYLPLSGGTLTGDVDITGDLSVSGAVYSSDPASGENSGQVPTTAWVQKLVAEAIKKAKLDAHPVGSYYWSNDSTSPATLFGGTWEALPAGYTLIAQGSGSDSFGSYTYTAGQKYGERKHRLTTDELASHTHELNSYTATGGRIVSLVDNRAAAGYGWKIDCIKATGGDIAHNNVQPCMAAYGWKRTA